MVFRDLGNLGIHFGSGQFKAGSTARTFICYLHKSEDFFTPSWFICSRAFVDPGGIVRGID